MINPLIQQRHRISIRLRAAMNSVASKRLFQEYKHLTTDPPDGITAGPVNEDDLFVWEAMIQGPEGTPYEGGVFPAELKFPKDYPLMPPTMKFLCDLWHPNGNRPLHTPPLLRIWIFLTRPQSIPTATSASLSCTRPETIRITTSKRQSAGARSRASRRSSSPS